jgi:hypothetical protein
MSLFVYREPVPERVLPTADESVVVANEAAQPLVSLTTNANSGCALDVDWRIALELRPRRTHCVFRELYRVDPALHLPFLLIFDNDGPLQTRLLITSRTAQGISQHELARRLGVHETRHPCLLHVLFRRKP